MEFIEIIKAIVYGTVEGITEWLPVSSTGHLILLENLWPMKVSEEFWRFFLVVVQLGAILAVVCYFWQRIWPFNTRVKTKPFVRYDVLNLWTKIIVSCLPAGLIGFFLDDWLNANLYNAYTVAVMLILVGVAFLLIENRNKARQPRIEKMRNIGYQEALIIGLFQLMAAIFPGTSRSGATILGALLIGVSREVAAEYTFVLAVPVMAGASLLKVLKVHVAFTANEWAVLVIGCLTAFLISLACIRFLMNFVKKHNFKPFGYYRIVLGAIVLLYFWRIR